MMFRRASLIPLSRAVGYNLSSQRKSGLGAASFAALMILALAGCATGDYAYVKTISTGERIQLALRQGSPVLASKGDITIRHAALVPNPNLETEQKKLQYLFAFHDKSAVPLKAVLVEDVSDEKSILMVDDQDPKLVNERWTATSRMFGADEDALIWVGHLGDTMRVYRFTITKADGSKVILDQGWMVPGWAKVPMRRALGLK
jgi:hypothetical protein